MSVLRQETVWPQEDGRSAAGTNLHIASFDPPSGTLPTIDVRTISFGYATQKCHFALMMRPEEQHCS